LLVFRLKRRRAYRNLVTPKAEFDPLKHTWVVGDFNVKLLHAIESPEFMPIVEDGSSFTLMHIALAALRKPKGEVWRYAVLSEEVIIKTGKTLIKAKIHGPYKGIFFIRVPHLGKVIVDGKQLRAPSDSEGLVINEFFDIEKKKEIVA